MAQLLIRNIDNVNSDPEKDKGCYKTDDVVVVVEDDHVWGTKEGPPNFRIEQVVGPAAQFQYLCVSDDQLKVPVSALKNHRMRHAAIKARNIKPGIRRRYRYTDHAERK